MRHVHGDNAHVAGGVVEGARGGGRGENGHACMATDEVRPFVGVGMPVQFSDLV